MNNNCSLAGYMLEEPSIILRLSCLLHVFLILINTTIIIINANMLERGPDLWRWFDKIQFSYHCVHPIHAKMFSIQMLLHFSQIVPRVCTLVIFIFKCFSFLFRYLFVIYVIISSCSINTHVHMDDYGRPTAAI